MEKIEIGSNYGGGIVFYLSESSSSALVCAELDLEPAIWGNNFDEILAVSMNGKDNTKEIVLRASSELRGGCFSFSKKEHYPVQTAARKCSELNLNGFNDWYLPSEWELRKLYNSLDKIGLRNLKPEYYWSSKQFYLTTIDDKLPYAECINFSNGMMTEHYKNSLQNVRPIRSFSI